MRTGLTMMHEVIAETSQFEDYSENVVNWSGLLYHCENVKLTHKVAQLDLFTPLDMRAPGAAWGLYALESAMDELAYKLGMNPLELRLKNYAQKDLNDNKPFSSKELRECYRQGAERFGWANRNPEPRRQLLQVGHCPPNALPPQCAREIICSVGVWQRAFGRRFTKRRAPKLF